MSHNKDAIYLYVKGNKGSGWLAIVNNDKSKVFFCEKFESLKNASGDKLPPQLSDMELIIKGMSYVAQNSGSNGLPSDPVLTVISIYETNVNCANGHGSAHADSMKNFISRLHKIEDELARKSEKTTGKIKYIKGEFGNEMFEEMKRKKRDFDMPLTRFVK